MPATSSPLVTAEWLQENIDAPDLRVIDATWFAPFLDPVQTGLEAYNEAHIPGAVFFDIDDIAAPDSPFAHTMPPPHVFSARVRKLGLGDGNRLIVYDRNNFFASARVWWLFRVMGVKDIAVLDGGFQAWRAQGGEIEDMMPVAVERHFTPRVRADLVKSTEQMAALAGEPPAVQIIDARPDGRFTGQAPEPRADLRPGHIPGSRNVPGSACLTGAGTLKTPDDLLSVFTAAGVDPSAPAVATCGSGVTAAVTALALATLGNDLVAVYDGSWTEWASDPANPIATGPAA